MKYFIKKDKDKGERIMIMLTINRRTYNSNDVNTAADIILGETGDECDYERMKYILGNMKFNELFRGENFVIQCFEDESND